MAQDKLKPIIAITLGDPCGIGPEVIAKSLSDKSIFTNVIPLVIGSGLVVENAFIQWGASTKINIIDSLLKIDKNPGVVNVLQSKEFDVDSFTTGKLSVVAGNAVVSWILTAAELAQSGQVKAIVTGPINKEACAMAGYEDIGHMEIFQRVSGSVNVSTMLMSGKLRVVHLVTHKSLRDTVNFVTQDNVLDSITLTNESFKQWGFQDPIIGVAALNPHASDGGLLGHEERDHILPAINKAQDMGVNVTGPIPADSIFHQAINGKYDVVIAMYHDQGHIPVKVHGFEQSISVNLGLPFIRTSVDHGTAFDIAGKGIASEISMKEAIKVAINLAFFNRLSD